MARVDAAADGAASPLAALEAVFMAHIHFVCERPGVPRLIFGELQRPGQTLPKQMVQTLITAYGERLRGGEARLGTIEMQLARHAVVELQAMPRDQPMQGIARLKRQLKARQRWQQVGSPAGDIPALLPPGRNNRYDYRMDPVPAVGEHTEAILRELGLDDAAVQALRHKQAI
jgi:hypothetical protein